uniref:Umbellolysis n=1 Tax=Polyporus umbellatus TaxID=158314 RepID=M9PAR6_9APHY|nr:umbellolysis [Polyporus umbellatus]
MFANVAAKDPRAYAQWVSIVIKNIGNADIKLKNLDVSWGKLYADGNKDKELPASDYEGKTIEPGTQLQLNACGRENSPSGTTGQFNLVDPSANDQVIRSFYWDCPWGSSRNEWIVSGSNSSFIVESTGGNLDGGALGNITVDVLKKPS